MDTEVVEKLDAACRQINTAISLWFSNGDTVSIHTLACSAYQIVHDINQKQGGRDLLYDNLVIKDEYRREVKKFLKKAYNFFKHAENDSYGTIEFEPILSELFIWFTIKGLQVLGRELDQFQRAFDTYLGLTNPDILTDYGKSVLTDKDPEKDPRQVLRMSKSDFFKLYIRFS
jgi:hypothetical protein